MKKKDLILKGFNISKNYLKKNSPDKDRITFLTLETKPICNQNCLYCSQEHRFEEKNYENHLNLKEYKEIITQAKELGTKTIVFAGAGEPTLDNNLLDLIDFNFNLGLTTIIFTNLLCSQDLIEIFYNKKVSLIIKLDTLKEETYKRLNGGDYTKFMNNLNFLLKLYKKDLKKGITRISANICLTNLNKDEINKILFFCEDNKIEFFVSPISKFGRAEKNWELLVGNYESELRRISYLINKDYSSSLGMDGRCTLFAYGLTIDINGNLVGCPTVTNLKMGNIRENLLPNLIQKYKTIWTKKQFFCLARQDYSRLKTKLNKDFK